MAIELSNEILDQILKDYKKPEDFFQEGGILKSLQKQLIERMLEGEMNHHLGYLKSEKGQNPDNARNGSSKKTIQGDFGRMELQIPRDRKDEFEPLLIPKGERRFKGFDEKIVALYSRGMSTRDISATLKDIYGIEVSADLVSSVTDEVMETVREWQNRKLDNVFPVVYFDALRVNIRHEGIVKNKAVYLALGIDITGKKELLGIWVEENESSKFWLTVFNELNTRGLKDILIACVDGLNGFAEAIEAVYPETEVQLCIVHLLRNAMKYITAKDTKAVLIDLKKIYTSPSLNEAEKALDEFETTWKDRYPMIAKSWKGKWANIIPFFKFSAEIRKVIYTTNAIESLNRGLRKVIKTKAVLPSDEAAIKMIFLVVRNLEKNWTRPIKNWSLALHQFAIYFGERVKIL